MNMKKRINEIRGDEADATAKRMARYGRTTWIVFREKDGTPVAVRANAKNVKRAMLATGTQDYFLMYYRSEAWSTIIRWRYAAQWLKNLKFDERYG